ncbi:MAG: hypothetical protein N3A62_07020 [Thermodesulfovibrionales bacterium]|nr:hypothetical protein [Thermodesulfovibrionales bacterium]
MIGEFEIRFTDKEVKPWGGMALMSRMMQKMGFMEGLRGLQLPMQRSNSGYSPYEIIEQFLSSMGQLDLSI